MSKSCFAFARLVAILLLPALAGCATVTGAGGQRVTIVSVPPEASCGITRNGETLATAAATPFTVTISHSGKPLVLNCAKPGFADAFMDHNPHMRGATVGNIMLGGLIGVAVDAASGANYEYDDLIHLALMPVAGTPAPVPPANACPAAGTKALRGDGGSVEYRGVDPRNWDVCVVMIEGRERRFYFDMLDVAEDDSLNTYAEWRPILRGGKGARMEMQVNLTTGLARDVVTNLGPDSLDIGGQPRAVLKFEQRRSVIGGNGGEGVRTLWLDTASGMLVRQVYQHGRGVPVFSGNWQVTQVTRG